MWPACSEPLVVSGGVSIENTRSRGLVVSNRYVPRASQRARHLASRPSRDGFSGTCGRRMALTSRRRQLLELLGYLRQGLVDLGEARPRPVDHRGRRPLQEVPVGELGLRAAALPLQPLALTPQAGALLVQVEQPGERQGKTGGRGPHPCGGRPPWRVPP